MINNNDKSEEESIVVFFLQFTCIYTIYIFSKLIILDSGLVGNNPTTLSPIEYIVTHTTYLLYCIAIFLILFILLKICTFLSIFAYHLLSLRLLERKETITITDNGYNNKRGDKKRL